MNAKLAKKLRRIARTQTIGKPARLYTDARPGVNIGMVHPETTRGVYKSLKKLIERVDREHG